MSNRVVITVRMRKMLIALIVVFIMAVGPAFAGTDNYTFLADQSSVVQTGGFAGVHETYSVTGKFRLTVDMSSHTASFDWVRATLSEGRFLQDGDLGSLFNMTELTGTVISATEVEFEGKTAGDPAGDIHLLLSLSADSIHLTGRITSPCCDFFDYALDAVAVKVPNVPPHPIPVLKYAVASPRACLIGPPVWHTDAYYLPTGDADNFPRANGSVRVRVGTRVVFCLSRDLEGVWYTGSYGCLGTSLVVQSCRLCKCPELNAKDCPFTIPDPDRCPSARCVCEQCQRLGAVCCPRPDDIAITPCPWVTIGKDGARDCRKGPSIGRAKVGVPVHFRRPGTYLLRAIVHTFAKPGYPRPLEPWRDRLLGVDASTAVLPEVPGAEDRDVIYIRIRVVELPIDDVEPEDPVTDDPDFRHIRPIPKDIDPDEPVDLDSDLNGDEVVDMADFAIMAQQWGREYEMPFTDDE